MPKRTCTDPKKKLEEFKKICREHSIKLTPQRLLIYEELIKTESHPSTDMLYQQVARTFPTISFDTVNRTLLTFHELGLAHVVEGTGNPKRFDGNVTRHHHFQCVHCKRLYDVYDEDFDALQVPETFQQQFQVTRVSVHLEGICNHCREKE